MITDRWIAAAFVAGDRAFVAIDAQDGRPVGSAVVHVTDRVATLGAMSTVTDARGRGIQFALIAHRLEVARTAGCELAVATTTNPVSARNLVRAGFEHVFTLENWVRAV